MCDCRWNAYTHKTSSTRTQAELKLSIPAHCEQHVGIPEDSVLFLLVCHFLVAALCNLEVTPDANLLRAFRLYASMTDRHVKSKLYTEGSLNLHSKGAELRNDEVA